MAMTAGCAHHCWGSWSARKRTMITATFRKHLWPEALMFTLNPGPSPFCLFSPFLSVFFRSHSRAPHTLYRKLELSIKCANTLRSVLRPGLINLLIRTRGCVVAPSMYVHGTYVDLLTLNVERVSYNIMACLESAGTRNCKLHSMMSSVLATQTWDVCYDKRLIVSG